MNRRKNPHPRGRQPVLQGHNCCSGTSEVRCRHMKSPVCLEVFLKLYGEWTVEACKETDVILLLLRHLLCECPHRLFHFVQCLNLKEMLAFFVFPKTTEP